MEVKAICEMTKDELMSEYLYCLNASEDESLDDTERSHYRRRADVVKMQILQNRYMPETVLDAVASEVKSK